MPPSPSDRFTNNSDHNDATIVHGASEDATVISPLTKIQKNEHISALPTGTRLFEFEITGLIGEGGFGIVYSAQDHSLERDVAIKEYMPSALASRTENYTVSIKSPRHVETFQVGLKSFVNEAKLLARFDHPSLVKVFRFWEANNTAYMAMPIYRGVTLKKYLKEQTTPPTEDWLRKLLSPLLDALEVIHEESCFHRDIAPDNIMLIEDEKPVLLDFGAARRVISDMTQDLTVILKPGYAPVEQYGDTDNMQQGPWTDIYALGAVLYFAIAGKAPEASITRLMNDKMVSAKEMGKDRYSESFLSAIDSALKIRPEERPQNISAFKTLLNQHTRSNEPNVIQNKIDALNPTKPQRNIVNTLFITLVVLLIAGGISLFAENIFNTEQKSVQPEVVLKNATETQVNSTTQTSNATANQIDVPQTKASSIENITTPISVDNKAGDTITSTSSNELKSSEQVIENNASASTQSEEILEKSPQTKPNPPKEPLVSTTESHLADRQMNTNLLKKAKKSLERNDYRSARQYADQVLSKDTRNTQALDIKKQALQAEKSAFDAIQIE